MSVVDEYFEKLEPEQRTELERIRKIVRKNYPEAEEVITYGMPGFKYKGKYLVSFNAFKDHLSLFPGSKPIEKLSGKLKSYKTSKGTIQFTLDNPIPEELIRDILAVRAADIS